MAGRLSGSYSVVVIPLRTNLCSLEGLRFFLWTVGNRSEGPEPGPLEDNRPIWARPVEKIKRLKDLEKEKDALWSGLEFLDRGRLWYLQRLEENRAQCRSGSGNCQSGAAEARSCLLRSHIQRVNGSLGSVMSEPNVSRNLSVSHAVADSDLWWQNTVLTQKVSDKNHQISLLELEKAALLRQLDDLQAC